MKKKKAVLELLADVLKIARLKCWDSDVGDEKAEKIIERIHGGRYGSREGIWAQAAAALNAIDRLAGEKLR